MSKRNLGSFLAKAGEVQQEWFVADATDQILGRLATKIATVLMGKHKPTYTAHVDTGDFVVVTNAQKIRLTGNKAKVKVYPRYSYYPGGYKEIPYKQVLERHIVICAALGETRFRIPQAEGDDSVRPPWRGVGTKFLAVYVTDDFQ